MQDPINQLATDPITEGSHVDLDLSVFAAEVAAPVGDRPKAGSLLEKEAFRFAEALEDYEHVSVIDIGGTDVHGFWVVVKDHRFGAEYEISSHCDYWDFVGAVVDHRQYVARALVRRSA